MGKASSSKKVARAARAGQSSGPTERRELGFPIAIALVVVLGVLLVAWARTQRETEAPTLTDHWHSAYGIYICDVEFLSPFTTENDPQGIHSHADSLIHIHPFGSAVTGSGATIDVFMEAMQASFDDNQLIMPDGTVYSEADTTCEGGAPVWQVARWTNALDADDTDPEVITEDLADVRFLGDGEAFTLALVPEGFDIPPPPSAANIADVSDVVSEGPVSDLGDGDDPIEATDEGLTEDGLTDEGLTDEDSTDSSTTSVPDDTDTSTTAPVEPEASTTVPAPSTTVAAG